MDRDPFEVLGLQRGCTQAEAQEKYAQLREKYKKERFNEGEAGAYAARKLQELEDAYGEILDILSSGYTFEGAEDVFARVASAVRNGELSAAQSYLDQITERNGEWHYYQALILYKKEQFVECRKQLQMAITLDPSNEKYQDTLKKLEQKMAKENPFSSKQEADDAHHNHRSYADPRATHRTGDSDACCRVCNTLICLDCCCECMGGDLISCC